MDLDLLFLFCEIAGEAVVLALVLYRRIWRELPVFSGYIAWNLATDIVNLWMMMRLPDTFVRLYFFELFTDSILQLMVVIELAWTVLRPILPDRGRITLLMLSGLIALLALILWPITGGLVQLNLSPPRSILVHAEQMISILRVLCFLGLAVFSQVLALGWKDRPFQVAAGLGVFSLVSLAVTVLHVHSGPQYPSYHWLDRLTGLSYLGALLYWIIRFSKTPEAKIDRV